MKFGLAVGLILKINARGEFLVKRRYQGVLEALPKDVDNPRKTSQKYFHAKSAVAFLHRPNARYFLRFK
jgi:hypothetical protein